MRIKRWFLLLLAALVMAVALGALLAPHVLRCYLVRWSDMQRIAPGVYVDPGMPQTQRDRFLALLAEAETRVAALYGEYSTHPVIIAGHTMMVMEIYGGNSDNRAGKTLSSGAATFVVLGPNGVRDTNILAHELAHAEFFARVGYRNRGRVPVWFDEGLAVQVDERVPLETWRLDASGGRAAPDFGEMGGIRHDDWLSYATAKAEVHRWLDQVGQQGLLGLFRELRQGAAFYQAYRDIEAAHASEPALLADPVPESRE
jgi:hypothetical protein